MKSQGVLKRNNFYCKRASILFKIYDYLAFHLKKNKNFTASECTFHCFLDDNWLSKCNAMNFSRVIITGKS